MSPVSAHTHEGRTAGPQDLERRLRILEAEHDIRVLMAAYVAARDGHGTGREIAELFTADGIWEGTGPYGAQLGRHRGRDAIARRFSGDLPPTLHLLGGEQIQIDGDHATGRWNYLALAVLDGEAAWMAGRYDNDFVVEAGRWQFAHVRVRPMLAAPHRSGVSLGDGAPQPDPWPHRARHWVCGGLLAWRQPVPGAITTRMAPAGCWGNGTCTR